MQDPHGRRAPDLYDRLANDAGFRRLVQAQYTGEDDVLEVAWWLDHPDEESPSGQPSITHAVRELQHRLYARSASDEDRATAAEELRNLQESIEASQVRLAEAVANAEPTARPAVVAPASERNNRRERRWWPLVAVAVALSAMIGFGAGTATADPDPALPTATPDWALSTPAHTQSPSDGFLAVFDRPQTAADVPSWIPRWYQSDTFRILTPEETTSARIYLARDENDLVCLVAIVAAEQRSFDSCAREWTIPPSGLRIKYTEEVPPASGSEAQERVVYVRLTHDGAVEGGAMDSPAAQ